MSNLRLATFRADVTPPIGHPLCGGWIAPVVGVTDPQYALGVVLTGEDAPVVLCAVDWCEIRNEDHTIWREKLAAAVRTSPERVAVQCVHQHNAPLTDLAAQRLVIQHEGLKDLMDVQWFAQTVESVAAAARAALASSQPVTHVAVGQAKVEKIASNRRLLGEDGKVKAVRWSAGGKDPALREEPEGLIDPMLKTVSFWNGGGKLAALHYYATHPMSHYGDGLVTPDFAGLARERRNQEDASALHVYFTGCAGNVTAGKYNDGAPENRPLLTDRLHEAMLESERHVERFSPGRSEWRTIWLTLPARSDVQDADLLATLADPTKPEAERKGAALTLAYHHRATAKEPIPLTSLHVGDRLCLLHLPGEPFVEYQLYAQQQRADGFVAVAGYADGGTGYIPLARSYAEGGYEPTQANVGPEAEGLLKEAIAELVARAGRVRG